MKNVALLFYIANMLKTANECIELLKTYKKENASKYGIECIGIFGSFARGEQNSNSDFPPLLAVMKLIRKERCYGIIHQGKYQFRHPILL
jgi:predicted nucleotidyltransferase